MFTKFDHILTTFKNEEFSNRNKPDATCYHIETFGLVKICS